MTDDSHGGCNVCGSLQNLKAETVVFRDGDWTATSVYDAPGMVMLRTNTHNDGLAWLTPAAAGSLGGIVSTLSRGLLADGESDRVAMVHMGDTSAHAHFMLIARQGGGNPLADLSALGARMKSSADPVKTAEMVERIRDAFASASA